MDSDFWLARWREGKIGFHEGKPNELLAEHADRLGAGRRILVPLCGKTEDMAFLAGRGHEIVGFDLSPDALEAFFTEHGQVPRRATRGSFTELKTEGVALFAGDFFAATIDNTGPIDAFYDRAALIALPPPMRERYVRHLRSLLRPAAVGIVITFEYPPGTIEGPPFSVDEVELRAHYAGASVELLGDLASENPRLRELNAEGRQRCFFVRMP